MDRVWVWVVIMNQTTSCNKRPNPYYEMNKMTHDVIYPIKIDLSCTAFLAALEDVKECEAWADFLQIAFNEPGTIKDEYTRRFIEEVLNKYKIQCGEDDVADK